MKKCILLSVLVVLTMMLSLGSAVDKANADAILFPYVASSSSVASIVSVVNDRNTNILYLRYFYKPTSLTHSSTCGFVENEIETAQNDIVSFEVNGRFEDLYANTTGGPLFNDPMSHVPYDNDNFTMGPLSMPRRAFLIVDDNYNNGEHLYGEAIILETAGGAAWGYRAYNPHNDRGMYPDFDSHDIDDLTAINDALGEVLDQYNDTDNAAVTLMPANEWQTRFFVTPIHHDNQALCEDCSVTINLTRDKEGIVPGVYDRDTNPLAGSNSINVVCVSGVSLEELLPASVLAVVNVQGGWGYVDIDFGTGTAHNTQAAVVIKLEYNKVNYISPLYSNSFVGTVNTAVWLQNRDNSSGTSGF